MTAKITKDTEWLDRRCKYCGVTKPLTEFHKCKTCTSGYRYRCKACTAKITRTVYEADPAKKLSTNKVYKNKHWEHIRKMAYARRDPYKVKANQAVNNAIAAGKFFKEPCRDCGVTKVHFHHTDGYDKEQWFTGIWVCPKHHSAIHKQLRWGLPKGLPR